MRLLVIEDDDDKRRTVVSCLATIVPGAEIAEARSLRSGLVAILKNEAEAVVLDMSMPTYDVGVDEYGGTPQAFAGRDLLRHMTQRDIVVPAIVVTQYETFGQGADAVTLEQLDAQLREEHASYVGTVYYNSASEAWKHDLAELILAAVRKGRTQ